MKESAYNVWVDHNGSRYVYNGISGALLRVSPGEYEALQRFLAGDLDAGCPATLAAELIRGRMVVRDEADELAMLAVRYRSGRRNEGHFALTLITSLGCNFDCPYCFEAKHPSIMSEEVEAAILRMLDDKLPSIKRFGVSWFGGEPLVGKRPLLALSDAFIARCDNAGVEYQASITTNGYLLDKETCGQLRDRRVTRVQVSLDGPPRVHDHMRPLAGGRGTFWRILDNITYAKDILSVTVRINVDKGNFPHAEELLKILAEAGLAGQIAVYIGQLVDVDDGANAPSTSYSGHCFTNREYAQAQQEFADIAARHGFAASSLPAPTGAPCTAVRANELVVGSKGELYKCYESVGNRLEVIGDIRNYTEPNGRLEKWLKYDPFADQECRSCIALPVCMGGCAHHAMDPKLYSNRCDAFRHAHHEQVLRFVRAADEGGSRQFLAVTDVKRSEKMR